MRKLLLFFAVGITIVACKTEPKEYVSFSGEIINKNSDSIVILNRTFSKTIKVNEDGTFSDTLKVESGMYSFYDGKEFTSFFLKNGFELNLTLDARTFDETLQFTGTGSEHSNFIVEKSLLEKELLDVEALKKLDLASLDKRIESIKIELSDFYDSNKNIDTTLTNSAVKNLEPMLKFYKEYIGKSIVLQRDLPKGAPSPVFEAYENFKGGTTSLTDLKGKYVYMDIWATWCGPCKREIPSLKKVEAHYHGKPIQFVSISIDREKDHEAWKSMIEDKELGGIQLFADNNWSSKFIKDYKIDGIPRFILIDPKGNIVSADAPRPSDPKLIELFNELEIK